MSCVWLHTSHHNIYCEWSEWIRNNPCIPQLYEGDTVSEDNRIAHLCGDSMPSPSFYVSQGNTMLVRITTDDSGTFKGFKATYTTGNTFWMMICLFRTQAANDCERLVIVPQYQIDGATLLPLLVMESAHRSLLLLTFLLKNWSESV